MTTYQKLWWAAACRDWKDYGSALLSRKIGQPVLIDYTPPPRENAMKKGTRRAHTEAGNHRRRKRPLSRELFERMWRRILLYVVDNRVEDRISGIRLGPLDFLIFESVRAVGGV